MSRPQPPVSRRRWPTSSGSATCSRRGGSCRSSARSGCDAGISGVRATLACAPSTSAGRPGSTWAVGLAERVLGKVAFAEGHCAEAAQQLRYVLGRFEAIPAPAELARTLLDLTEVVQAQGEQEEVARCLVKAVRLFRALDAPRYVARAVQLTERFGIVGD